MNRDDIIRLALESGFSKDSMGLYYFCGRSAADSDLTQPLAAFAALVAEAEREACAKVADEYAAANVESDIMCEAFSRCAEAIRARGEAG